MTAVCCGFVSIGALFVSSEKEHTNGLPWHRSTPPKVSDANPPSHACVAGISRDKEERHA